MKRSSLKFFLALFMLAPVSFLEAKTVDCPAGKICNPLSTNTVQEFIEKALEGLLRIGIPLVAIAIIYSGFLFVMARGNSEKLKTARDSILYTVIGAAILLGAWTISKIIASTVTSI